MEGTKEQQGNLSDGGCGSFAWPTQIGNRKITHPDNAKLFHPLIKKAVC
jgi:hypothetical protein